MPKFIDVFSLKDKEALTQSGYTLLKSDDENQIYVFENTNELKFIDSDMEVVLSDILTF